MAATSEYIILLLHGRSRSSPCSLLVPPLAVPLLPKFPVCGGISGLTWLSSVWSVCTSTSLSWDGGGPAGVLFCPLDASSCCNRTSTLIMWDLSLCSSSCLGRPSRLPGGTLGQAERGGIVSYGEPPRLAPRFHLLEMIDVVY